MTKDFTGDQLAIQPWADAGPEGEGTPVHKTIYLAGGCFWGVEHAFRQLRGVVATRVGYANGTTENPSYQQVCTGRTGHHETVEVVYDPQALSLGTILDAFFMLIDPGVRNGQGNDHGPQYQTAVFYTDPADLPLIEARFEQERDRHTSFFVELAPLTAFWPAEDYHQDYLDKNPGGYCHISPLAMAKVRDLNG